MPKHSQKGVTFIPSSSEFYRKLRKGLRETKDQRTASEFERDLSEWQQQKERQWRQAGLKDKGKFKNYRRFLRKWLLHVRGEAGDTLEKLYFRYAITPGIVLQRLWHHLVEDEGIGLEENTEVPDANYLSPKIRSYRKRERDARQLETAAQIVREWMPLCLYLPLPSGKYSNPDRLLDLARALRELGPGARHRPALMRIKTAGKFLMAEMKLRTGLPLHEHVGQLIKAASFREWNPAKDIGGAIKKLVRGVNLSSPPLPAKVVTIEGGPVIMRTGSFRKIPVDKTSLKVKVARRSRKAREAWPKAR